MNNDFKIFFNIWETKKRTLLFCGRNIFEFNTSSNLYQRDFVWLQDYQKCIGLSSSNLKKEERDEETNLNLKGFYLSIRHYSNFFTFPFHPFIFKTFFEIHFWCTFRVI